MSFAAIKKVSRLTKPWKILTFFLFLLAFSALLLFSHLLFLKRDIQQQELRKAQSVLENYISKINTMAAPHFALHEHPHGLDFIRLIRKNDQLLLTNGGHLNFKGVVDLAPSLTGIWVSLQTPHKQGNWLLVSVPLPEGGFAQGGKNVAISGITLYKQAVSTSLRLFFYSFPLCLGLAFLIVHIMESPLRVLEATIESALQQKPFTPPAVHKTPDQLHRLLGEVFHQNARLISEMQSSLDNVAHDLRTPMTRLRAVAEYALQSDSDDPGPYRNAISDCLEESERVLSMLGTMMSVAEAEAGTMCLELQQTDILETLEDVTALYQYVAEEAGITIHCSGEPHLFVQADKTRITQVWANLLDNGIKYGHESGSVGIIAKSTNDMVVITFTDDGMGISESETGRIWDRLYRGDRSRTKQGLGLGLNYAKAVVDAHGGKILVTSTIREGSRFKVQLPRISKETHKTKHNISL